MVSACMTLRTRIAATLSTSWGSASMHAAARHALHNKRHAILQASAPPRRQPNMLVPFFENTCGKGLFGPAGALQVLATGITTYRCTAAR